MNPRLMTSEPSSDKSPTSNLTGKWSEKDLAVLTQLVAEGATSNKIAALPIFKGRYSRSAIVAKAGRMGLHWKGEKPKQRPTEYRKVRLEDVVPPSPAFAARTIFALRAGDCRYPLSGDGIDVLYCCKPTVGTGSWCALHHSIVFGGRK